MADDVAQMLRRIADTAQGLRLEAANAGLGLIGYLLEQVLHEARHELGARGLPLERPPGDGSNVIKLK